MPATGTESRVCVDIVRRQRYGLWTIVKQIQTGKHKKWIAECNCGTVKEVFLENLVRGKSTSCGCHRNVITAQRSTTHGLSGNTPTYRSWAHMKGRCINPNDTAYSNYGGRGIKVCDRWLDFHNFLTDMGECPKGYSIERKNVNGNYDPENCVWLERRFQARNTRATRFDVDSVCQIRLRLEKGEKVAHIAKEFGCSSGHIRQIRNHDIWNGV